MPGLEDMSDEQFGDFLGYIFMDDFASEPGDIDVSILTDEDRAALDAIDIESIIELARRKSCPERTTGIDIT